MKSKISKIIFFTLLPIICFAVIGFFGISSFVNGYASAYSGNGGVFYVGKNSVYNHTTGTISGASATNGGAFYVENGGTLNISGGTISGNTATQNGNNIYNNGITTINGGGVGDIIEFGSYPQTIKASNITVDETKYKINQAGEKYYLGSDGEYYAKFTANPYGSSYVFSDGTTIVSGTSYYFKVEPIKWRILSEDNGQAIILAELILDAHQFYSSTSNRTIDGQTIYANNYKYSDIRSWLNGYSSTYGEDWNNKGFLQRAFSESEQEYIQTTLVNNSASTTTSTSNSYACENTNDKVWLLSYRDLVNTSYGFNSDIYNYDPMRMKKTSDYSRANYAYYNTSSDYLYNGVWWARSPSFSKDYYAWRLTSFGVVYSIGVDYARRGVVPALTIAIDEYVASDNKSDYGIYNTGTLNLYGGLVYDHIYSSGTLNTKMSANLQGQITLSDTATIVVEDYAGVTPNYKINLLSTRKTGVIMTFKGSSTEPDISKLTVTGYNTTTQELRTVKDGEENWIVQLRNKKEYTRVEENGYSYVYFGSYPQTIKASNVTIDESKYKTNQAGEKYYLGSDGEYYAKFTANPYGSSYVFSDGTTIVSGTSYYFKVEPIKWRILSEDNGQAIILAELILDAHQFYSSTSNRTIDGQTIYANNYKYSDIRTWLNGYSSTYGEDWNNKGFLQRAFSESEQEYIQTTLVDNSASTTNSTSNSYACENTSDKVWLLSYQDMINTSYGFNSNSSNYDTMRRKKTSDYSRANYAYYYTSSDYLYNGFWWSRSPSSSRYDYAWSSNGYGRVDYYNVYDADWGVVPALTISLNGKAGDTPVSWSFASGASENNASADTLHKSETLATNSKANSIFNFNTFATIKEYNNTLFGFNAFTNANYYLNTLHNFNGFANNKNRNIIYDFENKDGKTGFLTQTGKSLTFSCSYCMSEGGLKNFNTPQYIVNTLTNIDLLSDKRKSYALLFGNKKYKAFYEPKVYEIA